MPQNIELKARLPDISRTAQLAHRFATSGPELLLQCDTYFRCANGRLKLREFDNRTAELIAYDRSDSTQAKLSNYTRIAVQNPEAMKQALESSLGVDAIVKKRRRVWWFENIRIHLDEVERLGNFLEFEAVLDGNHNDYAIETERVNRLAEQLGIREEDYLAISYRELLMESPNYEPPAAGG